MRSATLSVLIGLAVFTGWLAVAGPVEVTFWHPYGATSWTGEYLQRKAEEFNATHPSIHVTLQSFSSYLEILQKIQQAAVVKQLPSIACIGYGLEEYLINSGLVTPLEGLLAPAELTDFFPSLLAVTSREGKVYGIPFAFSVPLIFYHSDLFEVAGMDPNSPPRNWQEFLQMSKVIAKKLGIFGSTMAFDDPWTFETTVRSSCGSLISSDGSICALDSEIAAEILAALAEGTNEGWFLFNLDFFQTLQTFLGKGVAMFGTSSYGILYYHENVPEVKAAAWPVKAGCEPQLPAGGNALFVFGNNDGEREAAAKFVVFLTSQEAIIEWAENSGYLPTRQSALAGMAEFIHSIPNYETAVRQINYIVPPTRFPARHILIINDLIMDTLEKVLVGKVAPVSALAELCTRINQLLGTK
ncbi:MAG: extracellular solute-binding protein [Candidatus Hadarchaeum sp.]|uniref:extracellular solute-binding protein n=1 Tax=Candidatus Hadarchaeum sp. TaxID=2883567 RepID=UPI00317A2319